MMKAFGVGLQIVALLSFATAWVARADAAPTAAIDIDGKGLKLNGTGVRRKSIFRIQVYRANLYLESPAGNAEEILAKDGARRLELVIMHNAPKRRIEDEFREGIASNAGTTLGSIAARLDAFVGGLADLHEGQQLSITYMPGKGTTLSCPGGRKVVILGKDFADAVFAAWLGKIPLDGDLKQALLGKP